MFNTYRIVLLPVSPGVIITEIHKRAGQDEEQYAQVFHHTSVFDSMFTLGAVWHL